MNARKLTTIRRKAGTKGGKVSSKAKTKAARRNAKKGGRPALVLAEALRRKCNELTAKQRERYLLRGLRLIYQGT